MSAAPLILIVEDESDVRLLLITMLEQDGYRVAGTNESSTGADIMRALRPDLLIADIRLRGGDGNDLAELADTMDIPVLLISADHEAVRQPATGRRVFLPKPFRLSELETAVATLVRKKP